MKIARDPRFIRDFAALPAAIQERAEKKLALFLENPQHPSLQTHKMEGCRNIWESWITGDYRFTFEIAGDIYKLRRVGTHEIYRNP